MELHEKISLPTDHAEPDPVLAALVDLANEGASMSITLTLGGLVVEGLTISGHEFYQRLKSDMRELGESGRDDVNEAFDRFWDDAASIYPDPASDAEAGDLEDRATSFIHLADVRFRGALMGRTRQWRGRLVDVTGWNIGQSVDEE